MSIPIEFFCCLGQKDSVRQVTWRTKWKRRNGDIPLYVGAFYRNEKESSKSKNDDISSHYDGKMIKKGKQTASRFTARPAKTTPP